ncbi:MAG: 2OG-Fe(II) oxygenase [Bacteriovoracaceae bacterium]
MQKLIEQIVDSLADSSLYIGREILTPSELSLINQFVDENAREFIQAKVGKIQRERREDIRGDYTLWLDPANPQMAFKEITTFLEDLKKRLNQKLYLGLKEFEYHLAIYPKDSFYKIHLDRFEVDSSRCVTFIFYLTPNWIKGDGGELVIYDKQGNVLQIIEPLGGTLVCFLSDEFPHEVKMALKERRSLTGWIHNKIIY